MIRIDLLEHENTVISFLLEEINSAKNSDEKTKEMILDLDAFAKQLMVPENIPIRLTLAFESAMRENIKMFIDLGGLMACIYSAYFAGLAANKEAPAIEELEKLFKLE